MNNEVDFAFDQLEAAQQVRRDRGGWEITEKGLERLRRDVHYLLARRATAVEWEAIMACSGSSGNSQLLCLLQLLEADELFCVVQAAKDPHDLFLAALNAIPVEKLGNTLTFMYEEFRAILSRTLCREYAPALAQA